MENTTTTTNSPTPVTIIQTTTTRENSKASPLRFLGWVIAIIVVAGSIRILQGYALSELIDSPSMLYTGATSWVGDRFTQFGNWLN